ncbi:ATP-binding protein, partial [Streptomyces sp. Agncl-13]|uniref:ATP-binding protein n=1 Tax=Streptomyces sp. Agncl-13 TaxID=3400628 RepID=UPI003A8C0E64
IRDSTSPKICRDLVALLLQVTGHPQHADTARLLVSEIVTNVNLHTDSLAVRLEVVLRQDRLRVSVYDDALDADPRQKPGDAYDEHGRGLLLLTGLARDWGVQRGATAHGTPANRSGSDSADPPAASVPPCSSNRSRRPRPARSPASC